METATRTSRTGTRHHHRPAAALSEKRNRAYIEDGEVKWDIVTEDMSIEEAKELTLKVVELEYHVAAQPSKDGNKKAGTWQTKANGTTPTPSTATLSSSKTPATHRTCNETKHYTNHKIHKLTGTLLSS